LAHSHLPFPDVAILQRLPSMSTTSTQQPLHLTLAASLHVLAVAVWFLLESTSAYQFYPDYYWSHNAISDLGIPYDFEDDKHGNRMSRSQHSSLMNTNFRIIAVMYAAGQTAMLYGAKEELPNAQTEPWRYVREIRIALSLVFMSGLFTVGCVHAGPQENADGQIVIHLTGAMLAIFAGNINSILCAVISCPLKTSIGRQYQMMSFALGVLGVVGGLCTQVASAYGYTGVSERLSVYCILAWGLATGLAILVYPAQGEEGDEKLE
jgi:hypothetical membrane protein